MNQNTPRRYWKSRAEQVAPTATGGSSPHPENRLPLSRRQFLEAAGFTLGAVSLSGCGRAPVQHALPFVEQPEGAVPGQTALYASTCGGCSAACGLLVSVRDGRPLKMEGSPEHPLSRGGLCAVGQALPLGLYDNLRLAHPLRSGEPATWDDVDAALVAKLREIADRGGALRFVSNTIASPTLQAAIEAFLKPFANARHITLDAISSSAILDAHEITHGVRVLPRYKLDSSRVIVAFGADFLGTWISPVEFTTAWRSRRVPTAGKPEMSHHIQLEGRMSLTGSNADKRYRVDPEEFGVVLSHLASRLARLAEAPALPGTPGALLLAEADLDDMARRLWAARGACVVLCDSQDVHVQLLVNYVNHTLGNYGTTVDLARPSRQKQGNDRDVLALIEELQAGKVSALFVAGTDFTHHLPARDALARAIGQVGLVVSFAEREDDLATLAHFVCPDHHPLEAWLDAEPVAGLVSLSQPTLAPLGNTRSILESLVIWSGRNETALELIRANWQTHVMPRTAATDFDVFWDKSLHDGFTLVEPPPLSTAAFRADAIQLLAAPQPHQSYALTLYSKIGMCDSRHAHNPWLQELPDPVTKVVWDNYVCLSPQVAEELQLSNGDVVRVGTSDGGFVTELPALVQPGQHDRVLAIALGYGVRGTDRFAQIGPQWLEARPTVAAGERVGKNVAGFVQASGGTLRYTVSGVTLRKTGIRHELACTQEHHSLTVPPNVAPHGAEVRDQVQETTLAAFAQNPLAGKPESHVHDQGELWAEDHSITGPAWGMVIDLNACTGCSACLIACQSENNVPVVGKDEVFRQREMHWIRLDRYYAGEGDDVDVVHQPMMCQHCGNAPCETVCPVLATVHSDEGLNEQVYNRCVGTRYCSNNCPYKVRRFNWFGYAHAEPLLNLALNPDVTVRTRGVMEKCSLCVQRIEEGKIAARHRREPLADGAIQTACQQSCPAQAIVFGDLNDVHGRVHAALQNPRGYRVLEELNVRPAVSYLRVVRNRPDEHAEETKHG